MGNIKWLTPFHPFHKSTRLKLIATIYGDSFPDPKVKTLCIDFQTEDLKFNCAAIVQSLAKESSQRARKQIDKRRDTLRR